MKRNLILIMSILPVLLFGEAGTESLINSLGIGGASGAMSNAFTSIESPYSIMFNPSLVRAKRGVSFTYMHDILQYGANYDVGTGVFTFALPFEKASFGKKVKNNSIALAYYLLSDEGIPITEAGNDTIGGTDFVNIIYKGVASYTMSRTDFAINRKIADFNIGFLASYLYSSMYNIKGKGAGIGGGIGYDKVLNNKIISGFGMGITYKHFSYLKWDNGVIDTVDCNYRAGVNIRILKDISDALDDGIIISFDIVQNGDLKGFNPDYKAGMEWKVFGIAPIRMGIDNGHPTAGIGFETKYIDFDYAFISNPVISSTHKFSITINL